MLTWSGLQSGPNSKTRNRPMNSPVSTCVLSSRGRGNSFRVVSSIHFGWVKSNSEKIGCEKLSQNLLTPDRTQRSSAQVNCPRVLPRGTNQPQQQVAVASCAGDVGGHPWVRRSPGQQ